MEDMYFIPAVTVIHIEWIIRGGIAQLGERLNGIQEASGSNPLTSTIYYTIRVVPREKLLVPYQG